MTSSQVVVDIVTLLATLPALYILWRRGRQAQQQRRRGGAS
jgi:hypothetical protein